MSHRAFTIRLSGSYARLVGVLCLVPFTTFLVLSPILPLRADTNSPAGSNNRAKGVEPPKQEHKDNDPQLAEKTRMACIDGRRYIAGQVTQILSDGLVVDSGYSKLLSPPFNQSWVVRGNVSVTRDSLIEEKKTDAVCVGLVFLTNTPKRPAVKPYDYVVIHGYPAGRRSYTPVPGVQKDLRVFSASLERAVAAKLSNSEK